MSSTAISLPVGFSWLSPAFRPSEDEIQTYAAAIAAREGALPGRAAEYRREAELQLWVWHNEMRRRPRRLRRPRLGNGAVFAP